MKGKRQGRKGAFRGRKQEKKLSGDKVEW